MADLRLAAAMLVLGCGARPLTVDVGAAGVGSVGAGGGGGEGGGGGAGTVADTGCANVTGMEMDCPGVETLALSNLAITDYVGDGTVSAGDAAFVSMTMESGDQGFSYPSIGLTSDNPLVTIAPALPTGTLYALLPHQQIGSTFDFLVDYAVPDGTVVHFTACPSTLGAFCRGGRRLSFDVAVEPIVFPKWIPSTGRPAGSPPCSSTAPASDRVCGGLGDISFSNPRAVFSRDGGALTVRPTAWLTNRSARAPNVCVRAATGGRSSNVAYAAVPVGKSAYVGTSAIAVDATLAAGAAVHVVLWVDAIEADCDNGSRIEFDASVP